MMRTISAALASLCILAAAAGTAAAVDGRAGTTAGEFLRLGAGARSAAMGEAFTAVTEDVSALYWNPGALVAVHDRQALLAHTLWYMDVNHDYAAYAQPLPNGLGVAGISATYLMTSFEKRAGDTEAADSSGSIGDMAVGVSYARPLPYGIDGGITAKYISSTIDAYSAAGLAFDLGFRRKFGKAAAGLAVRNLGGSLKYVTDTAAVGSTADLGIAYQDALLRHLTLAAGYTTLVNGGSSSVNAGAEYTWAVGQGFVLAPRAGFKSNGGQVSAGFGFGWKGYALDYAFVPHADLGSAQRISFIVKF